MTDFLSNIQPFCEAGMAICAGIYVLGVIWFISGMRGGEGVNREKPLVSVVIAARDEVENIQACLERFWSQDYPADRYEVIVVDDGSTDGTAALVREMDREGLKLLSVQEAYGGSGSKKAALSLGIQESRGEVILTTDADCLVAEGWVRGMVEYLDESTGMVVGFSQVGAPGQAQGRRMGYQAVDFLCLMGCILGSVGRGHPLAASGQNLAYRKAVFQQVGGYSRVAHRASGDDVLLLQMVRHSTDWKIAFATSPHTHAIHPPAPTWRSLLQQRSRWASNAPYQLLFDPLFFGYMLVTFALDLLLVLSPVLVAAGGMGLSWAVGGWVVKSLAEFSLFTKAAGLFGRQDLRRYFPLWVLIQPLHVVVVGALGCLGIFTWKGQSHRWGRRRST